MTADARKAAKARPLTPCAGVVSPTFDPWFSDDPAEREWAKVQCDGCPIAGACLAGAIERGEQHGTWGGVTFGVLEMATADELVAELLPSHGSRSAYMRCAEDGGRACGDCRASNAAYIADRRREVAFHPPVERRERAEQGELFAVTATGRL